MPELTGIPWQDDENAIDLVNKTAVVAGICNFDVSQIDIAHRKSEKGTAPIMVLLNRKADRTNFYRQNKVQTNHIVISNNEDSDSELSLQGLEREKNYIYMRESLSLKYNKPGRKVRG